MKLRKHNKYKSGVNEFLGAVPDNWSINRIKDVTSINEKSLNEKVNGGYTFKYIDIGNVNVGGVITEPETIDFENAPSRAKRVVRKNDVIVSTVRTYLKAVAFFSEDQKDVIVSTGFAVLSPYKYINPVYLAYLVKSETFIDNVIRFSVGVSYPAINTSTLASLSLFSPPDTEQQFIVNFLDNKTVAIDKKIALLQSKITYYKELSKSLINEAVCGRLNIEQETGNHGNLNNQKNHPSNKLPTKKSGIEWIGKIPEHWEVGRLKDVGYLYNGLSGKSGEHFNQEQNENSKHYIPFTNIANNKYIDLEDFRFVFMEKDEKQNRVRKNDLFFLMSSEGFADIGKSALILEEVKETYLNSFCKGFRIIKDTIFPGYLNYLLNATGFRNNLIVEGKGFTRINLKMEKVNDFQIIIPPLPEQTAIANYLDNKTNTINAIVKNISLQIETLKELRKTLINDVVTGKLKVPEVAESNTPL